MNKGLVLHYLSKAMLLSAALFLIPAAVSLYFRETREACIFLLTGVCVAVVCLPGALYHPKRRYMFAREGMVIATLLWVLFSLAGALPFYWSGTVHSVIDAIFESVSGFTTTGSSVLSNLENVPKGILFWRCFNQWIGGMGVLVLAIAILPSSGNALYLMQAECPGPQVGKIVPKGKDSALYLYLIYAGMTLLTVILLLLGGMSPYDSVCHAMSIAGTGGFSTHTEGISYYHSVYLESVSSVMMLLFGVNFTLYYYVLIRHFREIRRNTELRIYLLILVIAIALMTWNVEPLYHSIGKTLRYTVFQAVSMMTSTGFATTDYNNWPLFSQIVLLFLMFVGACGGSTGGGFKVQRFVILCKSGMRSLRRTMHPNTVSPVKAAGKPLSENVVSHAAHYLILYLCVFAISLLLLSLNDTDFGTASTAVLACINNMGPGINSVGPMENYAFFSEISKLVLALDMLLGRLEIVPVLVMLSPSVWKKSF